MLRERGGRTQKRQTMIVCGPCTIYIQGGPGKGGGRGGGGVISSPLGEV